MEPCNPVYIRMEPAGDSANSGVALGKGAWDCDKQRLIPPEKEV